MTEERLRALEEQLGATVPPEYERFIGEHRARYVQMVVSSNPDYWGVSAIFGIDDGPEDLQVDRVYALVHGAIPAFTLPIAEDHGELYLLFCDGPQKGGVAFWTHERDAGDDSAEHVADSFGEFLALLMEEDESV